MSKLISLEGVEGVGKSTAAKFIDNYLTGLNIPHTNTREPGGTEIAEAIRHVLLQHYAEDMLPETELLLMFAGRAQHTAHVIKPALAAGRWLISDRFVDASYAYQGQGRGISFERIAIIEQWVLEGLQADLTLLFDAPLAISQARVAKRVSKKDRIEEEDQQFFESIRQAYLQRAKDCPERFRIIDASGSEQQVQQQIVEALAPLVSEVTND